MTKKKRSNQPARRPATNQSQQRVAARNERGEVLLAEHQYSGPLPDAADFRAYDMVLPGAADRIMRQFEEQGAHRRELERAVIAGSEYRTDRGQWLGFILILAAIMSGTLVAVLEDPKYGAGIVGGALASGAVIYIVGGRVQKDED